jgi:predicted secreted hydrolase
MRLWAGGLDLELDPLMDDQELDSRASTGTIYWEGAVRARSGGKLLGLGYLELTGYWRALRM